MRPSYEDSFAVLKDRVEMIGDPQARVSRPPRHDDEELGPSIFRLSLEDVDLTNLCLPGLYVGRSELRRISFAGSDLHFSTFNWSDLVDCDFRGADLSGSDLRACKFVRCLFRDANLARSDLRGSDFEACAFDHAAMGRSALYRRPRTLGFLKLGTDQETLPLSAAQRAEIAWSPDVAEPGGG